MLKTYLILFNINKIIWKINFKMQLYKMFCRKIKAAKKYDKTVR